MFVIVRMTPYLPGNSLQIKRHAYRLTYSQWWNFILELVVKIIRAAGCYESITKKNFNQSSRYDYVRERFEQIPIKCYATLRYN
jgi:hypothetical protein